MLGFITNGCMKILKNLFGLTLANDLEIHVD